MRITTLFMSAILATSCIGQITIGLNEMPQAGNTLTRTRANLNPFINYGATGANFNWNFASLTAAGQDIRGYQSVGSTNIVYGFVFSDIFFNPNRANHATAGTDIPFNALLPLDDPYTFLFRSNSVYRKVGFGVEIGGLPIPIIFDEHDVIYELPLNFGNTSTSESAWNINLPTLAYYGYEQERNNVVDGWGTITTPSGSFNALRVKTTLDGRDSIQTDLVSLGFSIDRPRVTEYKWLANGIRVPVLQINTIEIFGVEIVTDIFFYDLPRSITLTPPLAQTLCPGSSVALNYAKTGVFNAGGFFQAGNIFRAQLSDATGSFANPVNIGQVNSTQSGIINATIPANTPLGTGYRIRVVSTNPAFTGTDNGFDIIIGETPEALALATGATEFCQGGTVTLSANTVPGADYQWQLDGVDLADADGAELTALASGSYTVTVSNACGASTSNVVDVVVNPAPEYALDQTSVPICAGGSATLVATDISGLPGLAYQWSLNGDAIADADGLTLNVDAPGSYVLLATDPATGCTFSSDAAIVDVEIVSTPTLTASGSTTFCQGNSVLLTSDAGPADNIQWYLDGSLIPGATDADLSVSDPGQYTAVATSNSGCTSPISDAIDVVVGALPGTPVVQALDPTTFCAGESVALTATSDLGTTLQWYLDGVEIPGATDEQLIATASGSYTAIATANGCSSPGSAAIAILSQPIPATPQITASGSTIFCQGGSVELNTTSGIDEVIQWYMDGMPLAGENGSSLVASDAGIYHVQTTSLAGCTSEPTAGSLVIVEPTPTAPEIVTLDPTTFCTGESVGLNATGEPGATFQWYQDGNLIPGASGAGYVATSTGAYTAIATNSAGCGSTPSLAVDVTVVDVPAVPLVSANGPTTFCAGGSVTLDASSDVGAEFEWYLDGALIAGATGATLIATEAGAYSAIATTAANCDSDVSAAITIVLEAAPAAPQVTSTGVTTFCEGGSVALQAAGAVGDGYQWYLNGVAILGADQPFLQVTEGGDYTVAATNAAGCFSPFSDVLVVNEIPYPDAPTIFAEGDIAFCDGLAVILTTDVSGVDYVWTLNGAVIDGATEQSIEVFTSGSYALVVEAGPGCSSDVSAAIDVVVWPLPAAAQISQNIDTLFATGGSGYQWYLNGNPIAGATDDFLVVTENGDYTVGVTDANGCSSISEVFAFSSVGITDHTAGTLSVYPNPSNGSFVLQMAELPGAETYYTIHDATGKLIQQGAITNMLTPLEIREARSGMYFLQVIESGHVTTHRVVVNH